MFEMQIDSLWQGKQDSCESQDQQRVTVPGDWTDLISTSFRVYIANTVTMAFNSQENVTKSHE